MTIQEIVHQFASKKILVVGDLMLNRDLFGDVDRISPEAPIPIVLEKDRKAVPGGAANAAATIAALGANCELFGIVGTDTSGTELHSILEKNRIICNGILTTNRPTTEKMRVMGNHQQIVRIDREETAPISDHDQKQLLSIITERALSADGLIICDYAKGVISESLIDQLRELARQHSIPILADVRPEHGAWYHDLTFITPNKKELSGLVDAKIAHKDDVTRVGPTYANQLQTNLLVTLSEEGLMTVDKANGAMHHFPALAQEVVDVSGAGDTVIATATLALASHATIDQAAEIANYAASVVVAKLGTATLTTEELLASLPRSDA